MNDISLNNIEKAKNEGLDGNIECANTFAKSQTLSDFDARTPTADGTDDKKENVIAGAAGALVFAAFGGLAYFAIYQTGFIAGICGLITVILSGYGYQLFSGKKGSLKGVILSVVFTVLVIAASEYLCISHIIYSEFKTEYAINFFDAVRLTPVFLSDGQILTNVLRDLLIAYALGAVASFGTVKSAFKESRQKNSVQK